MDEFIAIPGTVQTKYNFENFRETENACMEFKKKKKKKKYIYIYITLEKERAAFSFAN